MDTLLQQVLRRPDLPKLKLQIEPVLDDEAEQRQSDHQGRDAVAQVVLNRMRHPAFPKSICGVVGQKNQFAPGVLSKPMGEFLARLDESVKMSPDGKLFSLVDLPDHGRSPWSDAFSYEGYAARVAATLAAHDIGARDPSGA